ncbi:MAG: hypothetical protein AB7K52_14375 [Phycisphaerales bacterium]
MRSILWLCLGAFMAPALAFAQISVTGITPDRWGLSDESFGAGGGVVEDFEDSTLIPGLSILWESAAGDVGPVTSLPNLFDPGVNDPHGNAFVGAVWDGSRCLVSPRGNQTFPYTQAANWGDVVLQFDPPVHAVAFSIHQAELSPTLRINGVSRGSLFGLAGLAAGSGRIGFVIIESFGPELISSLEIDNVGGDGFAIDHLVSFDTDPVPIVVSGIPPAQWGAADADLGVAGAVIEDFEDSTLVPGLRVEINSPLGDRPASSVLPRTFSPVADDPFGDGFDMSTWDGSASLLNTRDNASHPYGEVGHWGDIVLRFDPSVAGVGFSMGEADADAQLIINGRDSGPLLAQAGLSIGPRQGYIRIDAVDPDRRIESVRIANARNLPFNDGIAIDHVALLGVAPPCPADFNADGVVNPDDLGDYINCYFALPPCDGADFNADTSVDPDDLGDFINAYFSAAC